MPSGEGKLWASFDVARSKYKQLLRELCGEDNSLVLKHDGDDGLGIEFDQSDFELVAKFLKPKRRR